MNNSIANQAVIVLNNTILLNGTKLTKLLSPEDIYNIALAIGKDFPKTNQELVTEFNETFKAEKETTEIVDDFKHSELRIALIMEECLELAFALNYTRIQAYSLFVKLLDKVYSHPPFINNGENIQEVFDALLDLLVVTYGAFDIFNMADAVQEGMLEVHKSNMSKLCNNIEEVEETVAEYRKQDIILHTEESNGVYIVKNSETNKILKSISYQKPNLKQILIKYKIL